jgi:hypothetical protein
VFDHSRSVVTLVLLKVLRPQFYFDIFAEARFFFSGQREYYGLPYSFSAKQNSRIIEVGLNSQTPSDAPS